MSNERKSLFSSDLWGHALDKYARETNSTVELFDADANMVLGPIHPTPLFQLFERKGYDPGLFTECARRCLAQSENRASLTILNTQGLAVIGTSLAVQGKIVGAAVVGYMFADFSQVSEIQGMARKAGIGFEELWRITREQKPLPRTRLALNGELLQVLGDAILGENFRTRQYEEIAADLEKIVKQRTESLRQLSLRLLHTQDEERQRIARELHDSVGQYLVYAKMRVESLARSRETSENGNKLLCEIAGGLDKCVQEVRTISYLLHPPLLDELGFASAAKAYVEGVSERSGIQVNLRIPRQMKRLPHALELVLMRTLQESLTNALRHAQSQSVDVDVRLDDNQAELEVRDYGKGLPPELLERFTMNGDAGGVGLNSMRQRVAELDGQFEIQSGEHGTSIRASLPLPIKHSNHAAKAVANSSQT